jgi:signal transduction histidine kinase
MYAATARQAGQVQRHSIATRLTSAIRVVQARPALTTYVAAICLLGMAVFASALLRLSNQDLVALAVLMPMAFLTECLVLRSSTAMTHSLSTLVYLAAIPLVPTPVMPVFASIADLAASLWLGKPWFKVIFNGSHVAITTTVASLIWWRTAGSAVDGHAFLDKLPSAVAAAAVFYLLNSWIIGIVASLDQRAPLWSVWKAGRRGVLLPQLGVCVLALLFDWAWLVDPRAILLLLVPVGVTWASFRQIAALKATTEESQQLAARWAILADASHRLGERADVDAVLQTGAVLIVEHSADAAHIVLDDGRAVGVSAHDAPAAVHSWLAAPCDPSDLVAQTRAVPLKAAGALFGTLLVAWGVPPTSNQSVLLERLAERVALAIHEALLLRQAAEMETIREVQRAKGEFLAAVSHEMRTPVGLLAGYGELLATRPGPRAQVKWIGGHMGAATRQLARMIDDLLDSGRIESGRFALNLRATDVGELVAAACDAAGVVFPDHRFTSSCAEGDLSAPADVDRLRQVLSNLHSNAARYSPPGTQVRTTVERRAGEIVVAVEDQGPGVPSVERARIFEKFYRAERVRHRVDGGLGLGLAIASDIVVAHGGRIWVEDACEGGGGARFTFTLPSGAPARTSEGSSPP